MQDLDQKCWDLCRRCVSMCLKWSMPKCSSPFDILLNTTPTVAIPPLILSCPVGHLEASDVNATAAGKGLWKLPANYALAEPPSQSNSRLGTHNNDMFIHKRLAHICRSLGMLGQTKLRAMMGGICTVQPKSARNQLAVLPTGRIRIWNPCHITIEFYHAVPQQKNKVSHHMKPIRVIHIKLIQIKSHENHTSAWLTVLYACGNCWTHVSILFGCKTISFCGVSGAIWIKYNPAPRNVDDDHHKRQVLVLVADLVLHALEHVMEKKTWCSF